MGNKKESMIKKMLNKVLHKDKKKKEDKVYIDGYKQTNEAQSDTQPEKRKIENHKQQTEIDADCIAHNNAFIIAAKQGDVNLLTDSYNAAKGNIIDLAVVKALSAALSNNKSQIIENFPIKLFSDINMYDVAKVFKDTKRENENESLKVFIQKLSKHSDEFKDDPQCKMISEIRKGDLVYGIGNDRNKVLERFFQGNDCPTADFLNSRVMNTQEDSCYYFGDALSNNKEVLNHAKYLDYHEKYNPNLVPEWSNDVRDIRVKRACKAAVCNVIEGTRDVKVHFVMDKFDPIKALNKREGRFSFTNSELRLIYRKWLENPDLVDKKIIFWDKDFNKKNSTDFFNSISKDILYIPKSLKSEGLEKLKDWAEKNNSNKQGLLQRR